MNSFEDAQRLDEAQNTDFHVAAFTFQCWISELLNLAAVQIAEKPNPDDRAFQNGAAWRSFLQHFSPKPERFPGLFCHLMSFGEHDDSMAEFLFRAIAPLATEHEITGEFVGKHAPPPWRLPRAKGILLIRSTIIRLCEWCFDPDPQKREWAILAINNRHFHTMSQRSQAHFLNHMSDAIDEAKNSSKWSQFIAASKAGPPEEMPWPSLSLDVAIIKIWPLLKRHGWSASELLFRLRDLLDPADLKPCPDAPALAHYCSHNLGLRQKGLQSIRNRGKNLPGLQIARHFFKP